MEYGRRLLRTRQVCTHGEKVDGIFCSGSEEQRLAVRALPPDAEGRNKLKRKAEEAVTRMGNLMRRGFSPVVREFASLSPPGVMKAIGTRASPRAEGEPKRAAKRQCMF